MDMTKEFSNRDSFANFFIIAALAGVEITDELRAKPRNVTMQLNGVEINPQAALKRLEEAFDENVQKRAAELFNEAKYDILEPFEEKVREMTEGVAQLMSSKLPAAQQ